MKDKFTADTAVSRSVSVLMILAFVCCILLCAATGYADEEYNPQEAGHPLKITAYLLFPIGTLLDYGLMRPAYWVVRQEPMRTIFGYEYMTYDYEKEDQNSSEQMLEP